MGFVDHLSVRCAMKCGLVDTRRLLKTEFREDAVDVALTRLSGVVYYLGCFSYTDTIHVVKEKAESLMESEGRARGDLAPWECYELGLTLGETLLRDDWTLRETGLRTGDILCVLCKKDDRLRRANLRLVDAVLKRDFIRAAANRSELRLICDQQDMEKDPMAAMNQTFVVDLVLLLEEAIGNREFARVDEIRAVVRFIIEQRAGPTDEGCVTKQACVDEKKQLLDGAVRNKEFVGTDNIQSAFLWTEKEGDVGVDQGIDIGMNQGVHPAMMLLKRSKRWRRRGLSREIIHNGKHVKILRAREESDGGGDRADGVKRVRLT